MSDATPLRTPPALKPGDTVSIIAPASSPKREAFEAALERFTALGYRVKTYRDFCTPHGFLSGTDAQRVEELHQAFDDPETTMVLAVRGGYGVGRILDRVDFDRLARRPKIVAGYSDITALHTAVQRRCGLVSFHAPNLLSGLGGEPDPCTIERAATLAMLGGEAVENLLSGSPSKPVALHGGTAEGRLVGGNLAVLTALLGTPDEPDFDGAILLLEDTGEVPYRVDRLLTQLRASGRLERIAGAVLGYFSEAEPGDGPTVDAVLDEFFTPLGVPVLTGATVGHEHPNMPMPLGAEVRLAADAGELEPLQSLVEV